MNKINSIRNNIIIIDNFQIMRHTCARPHIYPWIDTMNIESASILYNMNLRVTCTHHYTWVCWIL